ncbi:MAG: FAA hydrolase family protein [Bacteroidetes bacterium]|nr:FAA hydrolase family protein [Bacteroidota bacterium]PHX82906.1 MAG: 2-hydroxyhepta-2,4-diene-1,7-dioate isomerase [Flavobacteriales bacterium]
MKIICIGRNYAEHANEMNAPIPTEPILFMKPETALLQKNLPFYYPEFSKDIHYETEIVLKISKMGRHIDPMFANRYYDEIGIGIDFTARDMQAKCKAKGLPWEISKSFDHSAPIGKFIPKIKFPFMDDIKFHLEINKNKVQEGNTKNMLFSFDAIIAYASKYFTLKKGDLIFTGTPANVGSVKIGDRLEAYIGQEKLLDFEIK